MPADAIDIATLEIHDSPDVRAWAATTDITAIHFKGDAGVLVDFTKRDGPGSWPDVTPPGWAGPIEFTIWICVQIDGVWHGAGIIQCFRAADGAPVPNGGDITVLGQIANNWLYSERWGVMQHYQPKRGEVIGLMVTAGDARGPNDVTLRERSNVVQFPFPQPGVSDVTFGGQPGPQPVPTPVPQPPAPQPPPGDFAQLEELLKQHEDLSVMRHNELVTIIEALKLTGSAQVPYLGAAPITLTVKR